MAKKALYLQLWEKFRMQILAGEYQYGEVFPTERELEIQYSCDRKTIRKALNLLVEESLLVRITGKGTFVCKPDIRLSLENLKSFSGLLRQEGVETEKKVLFFKKVEAGYRVAKILNIKKCDEVYKCVRVLYDKENPIVLETIYILDIFPDLLKFDLNIYSLFEVMESFGQFPTKVTEDILAVELPETEAQYLNKETGDPAYLISDITENQEGKIIEYNRAYIASERFVLSTDLF